MENVDSYQKIISDIEGYTVVLLDKEGTVLDWNKGAEQLKGYNEEEIIGKNFRLFYTSDDREKKLPEQLIKNAALNKKASNEGWIVKKDGTAFWACDCICALYDEKSNLSGFLKITRDLTEKKTREKEFELLNTRLNECVEKLASNEKQCEQNNLQALINNTQDLLWSIDTDFKLISFNQPIFEAIKHATGKEISTGDNILSFALSSEQSNNFKAFYQRAFSGEIFTDIEYIENPVESWLEISFYPIKIDGKIIGTACHSRDITERKKQELEREKLISEVMLRNKNFEQFSYIVSHNLRAPIVNIMGLSNILKGNLSETDRKKGQQFLFSAVDYLDQIIKDLNEILKIKTEISENKKPVCFSELVSDIMSSIQNLIQKENVQIVTDFSAIDNIISLKSYINSIFYNLISNSIKYRKTNESPFIKIRSEINDSRVKLFFKDNGTGIDIEQHGEKLFGLYKRFHVNVEGKGLGLFMVKNQVEVLGGTISVKSTPGIGTEFIVELPM